MRYAILKWHMIALDYKYFVSRKKNYNGYYFGGSVTQTSQYSKGGFVAPQSLQDSTYYGVYKNTSVGFGFINGVQFYLFKTLTIDILAGLVYRIVIKEVDYNPQYMWQFQKNSPTGIGPDVDLRLGVNLGFRF
ncbi:MAG: DUF3575 domain-containing protein [Bacteroidia bacterium]